MVFSIQNSGGVVPKISPILKILLAAHIFQKEGY
jgi:hypothetical protein